MIAILKEKWYDRRKQKGETPMEWNPIDRKEDILSFLENLGVSAVLHDKKDVGYDDLEEHDFCIIVQNPYSSDGHDLYIDMEDDGEFTVTFGMFHQHYSPYESIYMQMLNDIQNILANKAYAWVCYEDGDWCMVSLSDGKELRNLPPTDLKANQWVECMYWNPENDYVIKGEA